MNGKPRSDNRHGTAVTPSERQRTPKPAAPHAAGPTSPPIPLVAGTRDLLRRVGADLLRRLETPRVQALRRRAAALYALPYSGAVMLVAGTALITLLVAGINRVAVTLPNPGVVYLPLIAMLAYHWAWTHGAGASALQLVCVYLFFLPPVVAVKSLSLASLEQLVTLALVDAFILVLVQLARARRDLAQREALRFAALNAVGTALSGELDEQRLLRLIAQTARDLTGAGFAAFTLRPVDPLGRPTVPAEGNRFHLASVVGVTPEQEALFRRMPLGGEGLLAPIFRYGVSVRVPDALANTYGAPHGQAGAAAGTGNGDGHGDAHGAEPERPREAARSRAMAYAHGALSAADLSGVGVPRGHPIVRSFLGAPLLDREGQVRGGLLLGHSAPGRFSEDDEKLLEALAAQAAVALENARLYRAARSQARELDAVFESIADGVSVVDARGRLRHENRAAAAIHSLAPAAEGRASEGAAGGHALAAPRVGEAINQALAGQAVGNVAVTRTDPAGERHDYLVSASPLLAEPAAQHASDIPSGDAVELEAEGPTPTSGAVVVWHDVTETRKLLAEQQARAQAEAQRALLQVMIDELPSGVYLVHGRDARLVLANRAAMDVWGADWRRGDTMTEFLATSGTQIVGIGGQPLTENELATLRALRTGEAVRHHQEIIRRPDGTALPVLLNAVALDPRIQLGLLPHEESAGNAPAGQTEQGAAGQAPGNAEPAAVIVLQDVTALKEAERLKDEFIAIAAHELKTPMAAVKGYADMLLRQSQRDEQARLAEWQAEALATIDQATSRLVELTNDLLDVTKIQAGRLELHPEPHDLVALVRRLVKRFQVTTERHTLSVMVESAEDHVVACVDVPRTEQVLANLLSNAIKYSPEGGAVTVTVREDSQRDVAEMRVRDQGIGIPAAQQARLFHRFARADNAREQGIAGTGLGLYLCRELVELQGGRIWFTSAEGQGTTVYVTLPLAAE